MAVHRLNLCSLAVLLLTILRVESFQQVRLPPFFCRQRTSLRLLASSTDVSTDQKVNVASLKQSLLNSIASTDRGRSASQQQEAAIETMLEELESACAIENPANSPLVEGSWVVDYTTAPPPSNGQLGPFTGIARQVLSLQDGTYRNLLSVNDILTASLDATWKEWDGIYLDDDDDDDSQQAAASRPRENNDDGDACSGSCWVVTFESLTIRLFGVPLITKAFDNVRRIWRTTYVDDSTRIVRAGRTGRQDDEMTFYMTRE